MKLTLWMPWEKDLTVNHMRYGARGGYRKKPHVQEWMKAFSVELWKVTAQAARAGGFRREEIEGRLLVTVHFRWPDARRRDTHNYFKVIADAVAWSLAIDDKDIRIRTGSAVVDSEKPGFNITIRNQAEVTNGD